MLRRGVRLRFSLGVLLLATAAQQEQAAERTEAEVTWTHTTVGHVVCDTANCPCNVALSTCGEAMPDTAVVGNVLTVYVGNASGYIPLVLAELVGKDGAEEEFHLFFFFI